MQGVGDPKAPDAVDAQAPRAEAADAGPHRGLHDAWRDWRDGHPRLSRPIAWLLRRLPLPAAWRRPPTSVLGRWMDASALVFLSVFLLAMLINTLEPFGLGNASKAQSMRITARAMAPFYDSPARDEIAVVLIDDGTLRDLETGWPPRYSDYEALLRRVLAHQPRAVYLDVLLIDERKYDDSLVDARDAIHDMVVDSRRSEKLGGGQVPVFFGVGAPGERSLFSRPGGVQDVVTSWEGAGQAYPLQVDCDTTNKNASQVDCKDPSAAMETQPTVAFALYGVACPPGGAPGCREPAADFAESERDVPMAVQWGWRPDLRQVAGESGNLVCDDRPTRVAGPGPSRWDRLRASGGMVWNSFWSGRDPRIEDRTRAACVYPATLFAGELEDSSLLRQDASMPAVLEDRVVLIGTNLLGLDDRVQSPVNQLVPGVYLHAMALDNLMTWGRDRVHVRKGLGPIVSLLTAVLLSLVAGAALCAPFATRMRLGWLLAVMASLLLVGLGAMLVVQGVFRQPPQDWLGTALAAAVTLYVISRPARSRQTTDMEIDDEKDDGGSTGSDPVADPALGDGGGGPSEGSGPAGQPAANA